MSHWYQKISLLLAAITLLLCGCNDDSIQDTYSRLAANFEFRYCATVPQMRGALSGSPGSFFTVRLANTNYVITSNVNLANPYYYTKNDVDNRLLYLCRAGFIIGTPVLSSSLEAYDLACPNCYLTLVSRPLEFESRTLLRCTRCQCAYSLDDAQGILVEGKSSARVLMRYHVQYDGMNYLSVRN